jgi:hypothetical protein
MDIKEQSGSDKVRVDKKGGGPIKASCLSILVQPRVWAVQYSTFQNKFQSDRLETSAELPANRNGPVISAR